MHITLPSVRADWRIPSSILPTSPTTILWELNFSIWELKQQTQNSQNELIIPADISARKIRMMKVRESTAGLGIASVSCSAWRLRWWGGLGGGRESSFIVDNGCWKKKKSMGDFRIVHWRHHSFAEQQWCPLSHQHQVNCTSFHCIQILHCPSAKRPRHGLGGDKKAK